MTSLQPLLPASDPLTSPWRKRSSYDVASALVRSGVLPELNYRQAVEAFGESGAAELIYLVGLYCLVSVTLNGFDVPVPEKSAGLILCGRIGPNSFVAEMVLLCLLVAHPRHPASWARSSAIG